jgi:hypothetical protein
VNRGLFFPWPQFSTHDKVWNAHYTHLYTEMAKADTVPRLLIIEKQRRLQFASRLNLFLPHTSASRGSLVHHLTPISPFSSSSSRQFNPVGSKLTAGNVRQNCVKEFYGTVLPSFIHTRLQMRCQHKADLHNVPLRVIQ